MDTFKSEGNQTDSPFGNLYVPFVDLDLTTSEILRFVKPFYLRFREQNRDELLEAFGDVRDELSPSVVIRLLVQFDWRSRAAGSYFAAILEYDNLEEMIGRLLLRSELCYAGVGYCTALSVFNSPRSREVLHDYLSYYLSRHDLWYDQGAAMAAVAYLDEVNSTQELHSFLPAWERFCDNKPNWSLDQSREQFTARMRLVKSLRNGEGR